jgi:hypothetical protein
LRIYIAWRLCYDGVNKKHRKELAMIRREKGHKRYAEQRERRFTEPLIREDEYERARMASERIAAKRSGAIHDRDDVMKNKGELTDYE